MNIKKEIVSPDSGKGESLWAVVAVLVVLCLWAGGIMHRTRSETARELESWELDAFSNLNSLEQGVYTDLRVAGEEIGQIFVDEGNRWCGINELQDYGFAPFTQDITWEQRGEIRWQMRVNISRDISEVAYLGVALESSEVGAFLLSVHADKTAQELQSVHQEIWYHPGIAEFPETINDSELIINGWRLLVAYEGEDEVLRIKGELL